MPGRGPPIGWRWGAGGAEFSWRPWNAADNYVLDPTVWGPYGMDVMLGCLRLPRFPDRAVTATISCLVLGAWLGCGCVPPPADPQKATDGNVGLDPRLFPGQRILGEPNDSFAEPVDVILDDAGMGHLTGTIASLEDVDIYALGSLRAGDRVIIDVGTPDSRLDPMLAVFDESGTLAFENDDRNYDLGQYDSFLNELIRRDSSVYFLAIARAPLGSRDMGTGAYEVLITVVRGGEAPAPVGQIVVLDFDGGTVQIPYDDTYDIDPFDAADISPQYAGMTDEVRDQIADTVRENYEGLALDVRVVPPDSVPAGCEYSTLYFGGRSGDSFGIAQGIDSYNQDHCDDAVIFTEMFTPRRFGRTLTATELGIAIGNVASHELGHLFGLNHVANVYDLMDTTGEPNTFYLDQEFTNSALDDSIFPIGTQDGFLWLLETLGARP